MADAIDDGLIKALEAADERLCELTPNFPPDVGPDMRDAEEIEKTGAVVMQIREALSRHKAPLSVAGDDAVQTLREAVEDLDYLPDSAHVHTTLLTVGDLRAALTALQVTEGDKIAPVGLRRIVHELRLSEQVFRDYARQHEDKASLCPESREAMDRMRKAKRNRERADACKAALDMYDEAQSNKVSKP